jgi:beta-barrel assembly-enhancing protease
VPLRVFAVSFLTALSICAQGLPAKSGPNFYSIEKERSLGASEARDFERRTTPLNSAAALDYVQKMGARLATQIPQANFSYTFAVIKDDEGGPLHEPVALPGGYIFVPAGLLLAAQNEAEMAGMLAHAMEHVAARHATREATRRELIKLQTLAAPVAAGLAQTLMLAQEAAFHRNFESEADRLAVNCLYAAGYDPEALASYIGRVQPSGNNDPASALPERDLRLTDIGNDIQRLSANAFSGIQAEVRGSLQ